MLRNMKAVPQSENKNSENLADDLENKFQFIIFFFSPIKSRFTLTMFIILLVSWLSAIIIVKRIG